MIKSEETKAKQEQISRNLYKLYEGINGNGRKDMPKPYPAKESPSNKDKNAASRFLLLTDC